MGACTERCWTPVPCPVCGQGLPPRGRDVPAAVGLPSCCEEHQYAAARNPRHLWDEHDSARHYTDPNGWKEHVAGCERCGERYIP